jgi:two-component system NtrC family sensor kinase
MIRIQLALARKESDRWTRVLEKRVEEKAAELDRAYSQASSVEKMASLGKLSAALAHEINNPLAGIRTYAHWLSRTLPPAAAEDGRAPEWRKALDVIEQESKRCGDLVRNLLTFARQTPLQMAPADLGEIMERCLLLVRHQAAMQNVEVQWTAPREALPVVCDAAQIQQALLAILMNGIEVMPRGGVLRIGVDRRAAELRILIADNGPGVLEGALPHLFEPFFTTKQEGKGTGLGLSLAHGIVTRHGGRIEVDPGPGRGAEFTLVLPMGGVETCHSRREEMSSLLTTKL